jgi:hypothetical protein
VQDSKVAHEGKRMYVSESFDGLRFEATYTPTAVFGDRRLGKCEGREEDTYRERVCWVWEW